jgi:vacuolar iron transporter family protein
MEDSFKRDILRAQANEITEQHIYMRLASLERLKANRQVLADIAKEEAAHYAFFRSITGAEAAPDPFKIFWYVLCARLLGLSFTLRLMERGEVLAQGSYRALVAIDPRLETITREEHKHEVALLALINEEGLAYTGSVVLGLNDALVELTGALAGFTLALQRPRLVAVVGVITGIAAALSMAAAEYLSTKEEGLRDPVKACVYTGIAYIITVALLVAPFLAMHNPFASLGVTTALAVAIIFVFNFYISVARNIPFAKRFLEMAAISLGVAALNYGIGLLLKKYVNI